MSGTGKKSGVIPAGLLWAWSSVTYKTDIILEEYSLSQLIPGVLNLCKICDTLGSITLHCPSTVPLAYVVTDKDSLHLIAYQMEMARV